MRDFGPEVASVAVLTPYKAQLALLKAAFAAQHPKAALSGVEFATVDGFQVTQAGWGASGGGGGEVAWWVGPYLELLCNVQQRV